MFETITKHVRENSVVRFLLSHLIILLAALLICAVGFRSAFVIVRNDVLDSTMFAMTQAVSSVDNGLTELRTLGMQTARSESIYRLENLCHTDDNYYQTSSASSTSITSGCSTARPTGGTIPLYI